VNRKGTRKTHNRISTVSTLAFDTSLIFHRFVPVRFLKLRQNFVFALSGFESLLDLIEIVAKQLPILYVFFHDRCPQFPVTGEVYGGHNSSEGRVGTVVQRIHGGKLFVAQSQLRLVKSTFAVVDDSVHFLPHLRKAIRWLARNDVRDRSFVRNEKRVQGAMLHFFRPSPASQIGKEPALVHIVDDGLHQFDHATL
jgi:hypothetical protein